MAMLFLFLVLPVLVYLGLALLPPRAQAVGFGTGAALVAVVWWAVGDDGSGFGTALAVLLTGAALAAAIAQIIRRMLPAGRAPWVYPLVVMGVLIVAGVPAMWLLGL